MYVKKKEKDFELINNRDSLRDSKIGKGKRSPLFSQRDTNITLNRPEWIELPLSSWDWHLTFEELLERTLKLLLPGKFENFEGKTEALSFEVISRVAH